MTILRHKHRRADLVEEVGASVDQEAVFGVLEKLTARMVSEIIISQEQVRKNQGTCALTFFSLRHAERCTEAVLLEHPNCLTTFEIETTS